MYSRTAQGQRAWESAASGLPAHYRRIIGIIGAEASAEKVYAGMQAYAIRQVQDWLDELETLGFVELRIEEGERHSPRARHKAA